MKYTILSTLILVFLVQAQAADPVIPSFSDFSMTIETKVTQEMDNVYNVSSTAYDEDGEEVGSSTKNTNSTDKIDETVAETTQEAATEGTATIKKKDDKKKTEEGKTGPKTSGFKLNPDGTGDVKNGDMSFIFTIGGAQSLRSIPSKGIFAFSYNSVREFNANFQKDVNRSLAQI